MGTSIQCDHARDGAAQRADPLDVLRDWLQSGRSPQMRYKDEFEGEIVHFSPEAEAIAENGFRYGIRDLRTLDNSMMYARPATPGLNFAFPALSRDAKAFAKTSRGAVILHARGILVEHMGDGEDQVIFWGPDAGEILAVLYRPDIESPWTDGTSEGSYAALAKEALTGPAPRP